MFDNEDALPKAPSQNSRRRAVISAIAILFAVVIVFSRLFGAGFAGLDDNIHVYANPYLNPPTVVSIQKFWDAPYCGLYVPLAYMFFALIAHFSQIPETFMTSMGQIVTVAPAHFHEVNIFLHAANSILAYLLLRRLLKNDITALLCGLIFALHPMQVESVGWVSELRGLSGSFFALIALHLFMASRELRTNQTAAIASLQFACALMLVGGMLCKPSIVATPLVCLAIDRIVYWTPWRNASILAAIWLVCTVPFLAITHSIQSVDPAGVSLVWQRPFVAGDALAFYMVKILFPINLCIDYGRTPHALFEHKWAFFSWIIPVAVLSIGYKYRRSRPLTWLGLLIFLAFLLPVLGLVPFTFQGYSTVSDRYAYLSLIGVALIVGETIIFSKTRVVVISVCSVLIAVYAGLSAYQTKYWMNPKSFLTHTLAINPAASFAYNNLSEMYSGNKQYELALQNLLTSRRVSPGYANVDINAASCYFYLGDFVNAKTLLKDALKEPTMDADNYSDMGNLLLKMNDKTHAIQALAISVQLAPTTPHCVFNFAKGLTAVGNLPAARTMFQRCISIAPSLPGPYVGLGVIQAQEGHLPDAIANFNTALSLDPSDPEALQDLAQAQQLINSQHG